MDLHQLNNDEINGFTFDYWGLPGGEFAPIGESRYKISSNPNEFGLLIHEVRHASQVSRGEFSFIVTYSQDGEVVAYEANESFNINHEIDAYRAQMSTNFSGMLLDVMSLDHSTIIYQYKVNDFSLLNSGFVRRIVIGGELPYKNLKSY